jgi:hypothetical protein
MRFATVRHCDERDLVSSVVLPAAEPAVLHTKSCQATPGDTETVAEKELRTVLQVRGRIAEQPIVCFSQSTRYGP